SAPGCVSTAGAETASWLTSSARWRSAVSSEERSWWPTISTVTTTNTATAARIEPPAASTRRARSVRGASGTRCIPMLRMGSYSGDNQERATFLREDERLLRNGGPHKVGSQEATPPTSLLVVECDSAAATQIDEML